MTKPTRTLADLRPVLPEAQWASALREAEFLRLPIDDLRRYSKAVPRRSAFEEDRARDACPKPLGFEVLRFTWRQVENERRDVAGTIRALIARDRAA